MCDKLSFWPDLLTGAISWFGFAEASLHSAPGVLRIVLTILPADRSSSIFPQAKHWLTNLRGHNEHLLERPVVIVLFSAGLSNAGGASSLR